tara:strand:- start:183 stop:371 length:189 start_codon:yes stop_codon:yes gene_type:complete
MHKVLKAIREASISVACLLDDVEDTRLVKDLEHIQNQITIIENYLDPFTVAELDEMMEATDE